MQTPAGGITDTVSLAHCETTIPSSTMQRLETQMYTVSQKKQDIKLLPITSANVKRFSKFFH